MALNRKDKAFYPHDAYSLVEREAIICVNCELVLFLLDYKLHFIYVHMTMSHRDKCYEKKQPVRASGWSEVIWHRAVKGGLSAKGHLSRNLNTVRVQTCRQEANIFQLQPEV